MIGTIVNVGAIVVGSAIGAVFHRGVGEKYRSVLYTAIGLSASVLGLSAAFENLASSRYPVMFILCVALGGLIGTRLDIDGRFSRLVARRTHGGLAEGLTTAVLLYCVGTLSMVGPVNSALLGDNTYLYTNATLDFVSSIIFATTYGFGIALAAAVLFCWQGSIYVLALLSRDLLSTDLISEIAGVGGVLILSTGLSLLKIKDCHTLNLLPSLFLPPLFFAIIRLYRLVVA